MEKYEIFGYADAEVGVTVALLIDYDKKRFTHIESYYTPQTLAFLLFDDVKLDIFVFPHAREKLHVTISDIEKRIEKRKKYLIQRGFKEVNPNDFFQT